MTHTPTPFLRIIIKLENDAFVPDPQAETLSILEDIVRHVREHGLANTPLRDSNGNSVGTFEFLQRRNPVC